MTWFMKILKFNQNNSQKVFNIAKYSKYYGYQLGLSSMVYIFLIKALLVVVLKIKNSHSHSTDNIWGADIANMQLISKFDKGIPFSLCVNDIFS